ncbi:MAG: hypothetical protein JNJ60_10895, partial [Rhodocyclaceae bacterium]|nr:hypothetical protein [Rhodocyclaceae bacterium]
GSGLVNGAKYQVDVVDEFSIKLKDYKSLNGATTNILNNTIHFASAHGFQDGDILEYQSDQVSDNSGLHDGGRYRVTVMDANTIQLSDSRIIDSLAISAAVAVAVSGNVSVGVAAAGAVAHNTIAGGYEASIIRSDVDAAGDVDVVAQDSSAIRAMLFSAAVAVSASGSVAVSAAMSVAEAENLIDASTLATIEDSTVDTTSGGVTVEAVSDVGIQAFGIAAAISAGGAGAVSVQVAAAGVVAFNTTTSSIEASIVDTGPAGYASAVHAPGDIEVLARDESNILAVLGAVSVAAGGSGTASINVSVAATYAENTVAGSMIATIADATVDSSAGAVTVDALADDSILAVGLAVGVSAGGSGGVSVNVALSAVAATNLIGNSVEASITDGSVVSAND